MRKYPHSGPPGNAASKPPLLEVPNSVDPQKFPLASDVQATVLRSIHALFKARGANPLHMTSIEQGVPSATLALLSRVPLTTFVASHHRLFSVLSDYVFLLDPSDPSMGDPLLQRVITCLLHYGAEPTSYNSMSKVVDRLTWIAIKQATPGGKFSSYFTRYPEVFDVRPGSTANKQATVALVDSVALSRPHPSLNVKTPLEHLSLSHMDTASLSSTTLSSGISSKASSFAHISAMDVQSILGSTDSLFTAGPGSRGDSPALAPRDGQGKPRSNSFGSIGQAAFPSLGSTGGGNGLAASGTSQAPSASASSTTNNSTGTGNGNGNSGASGASKESSMRIRWIDNGAAAQECFRSRHIKSCGVCSILTLPHASSPSKETVPDWDAAKEAVPPVFVVMASRPYWDVAWVFDTRNQEVSEALKEFLSRANVVKVVHDANATSAALSTLTGVSVEELAASVIDINMAHAYTRTLSQLAASYNQPLIDPIGVGVSSAVFRETLLLNHVTLDQAVRAYAKGSTISPVVWSAVDPGVVKPSNEYFQAVGLAAKQLGAVWLGATTVHKAWFGPLLALLSRSYLDVSRPGLSPSISAEISNEPVPIAFDDKFAIKTLQSQSLEWIGSPKAWRAMLSAETPGLRALMQLLPEEVAQALAKVEDWADDVDHLVLDLGSAPRLHRSNGKSEVLEDVGLLGLSQLESVVSRLVEHNQGRLFHGTRVFGVPGSLISVSELKHQSKLSGLTVRLRKTYPGCQRVMVDVVESALSATGAAGSLLLCGPRKSGKTSLLQAVAASALERDLSVVVIDQEGAFAGLADSPPPDFHRVRRIGLGSSPSEQAELLRSAVSVHMADVVFVDMLSLGQPELAETLEHVHAAGARVMASCSMKSFAACMAQSSHVPSLWDAGAKRPLWGTLIEVEAPLHLTLYRTPLGTLTALSSAQPFLKEVRVVNMETGSLTRLLSVDRVPLSLGGEDLAHDYGSHSSSPPSSHSSTPTTASLIADAFAWNSLSAKYSS